MVVIGIKRNLLIVLLLICAIIILTNCSQSESVDISDISKESTDQTKEADVSNEEDIESDIILIIKNYEFNLSTPFNDNSLKNLDSNELAILRNSIYAKHGYIFSTNKYNDYFSQLGWYSPIGKDVDLKLTNIDNQNIKKITDLEKGLESLKFKSNELGFSITFPISWEGKYEVVEDSSGIIVYFKPIEKMEVKCGEFFIIVNTESENYYQDIYDTVGDVSFFEANGTKYFIGGPTDFPFPEDHPELELFLKMKLDIQDILEAIEPL